MESVRVTSLKTRLILKAARGLEEVARRLRKLAGPDAVRSGVKPADSVEAFEEERRVREVNVREAMRVMLGSLKHGKFLDMGCDDGELALIARDLGWDVTATDDSFTKMPAAVGVEWVQADARAFEVEGYECVCLAGLLYRLELSEQLDLLRRCAGTPTIIEARASVRPSHKERGYEGVSEDGRAFHPTEKSLLRMVREAGFSSVEKAKQPHTSDRSFYLCLTEISGGSGHDG